MRALSSRNTKMSGSGSNSGSPRPPRSASGARYDVLDRVGEGTLFVVYRVREKSNNRVLALKALKNNFNAHPQFAPALAEALSAAANFSHPFLAQIIEVGREDGTLFQLQEWLPGQSLEARLRRAPFGRIETVSSTRSIAEALQYLHENGAVHGDLRPRQMISAGDGQLKLTDYNLSAAFRAANLSPADVLLDAVGYTAPEQTVATGQEAAPATPASDLYSLGVILYRMLAGRAPFDGPTPIAIAMRHRNDAPLPPSRFNPHCAPDLEEIALRLLQKKPEARFDSAAQLLHSLDGATATNFVASPTPEPNAAESVTTETAAPQETTAVAEAMSNQTQPLPDEQNRVDSDTSSTRFAPDAALSTNDANTNDSTTNKATANNDVTNDDTANAAARFPATMPISAIASAPLAALSAPVVAAPVVATTAAAATTAPTATIAAAATSVSSPPTLPPTSEDLAHDDAMERKAIKKHRRREAWGAFFAFIWIWVALGLLGGLVYGSYDWWVKQTPKDVIVPSYIGKNESDVKNLLAKAGLKMNQVGEVYDVKRPAGTVVRGFPPAGKVVKPNRLVDVTVSRGAEKVVMPDLSELDLVKVRQILQEAGLRLGNTSTIYHDKIARGYVCGQYPQPGDTFSRAEPINLVISRGPQPAAVVKPTKPGTTPGVTLDPTNPNDVAPGDPNALSNQIANDVAPVDPQNPQNPPVNGQPATDNNDPNAPVVDPNTAPMVSRTVRIRVPVPRKGDATTREVRIVVSDADGEHVVYDENHAPGELIEQDIQITRAQGGSATISVTIDGALQKRQRV